MKPSPPPAPIPPPPSMREAGELKLPSTLKRIDETNKSFILHPLVSEASGPYPFSGKHGFLSFQDFLSVLVVQLPKHFVRQIHTAECPMIIEIVDVEMLIIGLIDAEDIPIHARLCTIVRTEEYAVLILDEELSCGARRL